MSELADYLKSVAVSSIHETSAEIPKFGEESRVHDWRNYIPEELQKVWEDLPIEAKYAAYIVAYEQASKEDWD
jgi:hypothetical protein